MAYSLEPCPNLDHRLFCDPPSPSSPPRLSLARSQVNLDTLDLSRNKIDSFDGLQHLGQLTDLWVRNLAYPCRKENVACFACESGLACLGYFFLFHVRMTIRLGQNSAKGASSKTGVHIVKPSSQYNQKLRTLAV